MTRPDGKVNRINMNLYVTDTPLWYDNPVGPSVSISLSYNSESATAYHEPFGNKWQLNYASYLVVDTGGNVLVFMPDGRQDLFSPDGAGNYTKPYQVFNELIKISENHFELHFPDGTVYVYDLPSGISSQQPFLASIRDAYGKGLTFGYNEDVQLTTITDALGRETVLAYNADGLVTSVTDPFGRSASFEYDANRNLTKITDMGGYWSTLCYDEDIYLTEIKNSKGKWGFYIEPADGIVANSDNYPPPGDDMWQNYRITVTNPLGGKEEYFYYGGCDEFGCYGYSWYVSPRDYITWRSQQLNNFRINTPKTRYFPIMTTGGRSEIKKILFPGSAFVEYGYDSQGNRTSEKDAHGHTTYYTYNHMGRITSVTDPKSTETTLTYAGNGVDLLGITNGLGTIGITHNAQHDITSVTDRVGYKTTFSYNGYGQIVTQTEAKDVLDVVTTYSYDPSNHQLQQITKDGKTLTTLTYDAVGRVRTNTDATGLTLVYDYDNLNQLAGVTYPDGRALSYTYWDWSPSLVRRMTDRTGRVTEYSYDFMKRLVLMTNPEGGLQKYQYDANGNLTRFIDANGNVTGFRYDFDNRLVKKTYDDGKYVTYAYDSMGLLTDLTNARNVSAHYTYDENHNLLAVTYSDGTPGVTYQYDDYSRITQRQDGIGTFQYGYNANSLLTSVDGPWMNDTLTYEYDELGRRKLLSIQGGEAISYAYDNLDRMTSVQVGTRTYFYAYSNSNPIVQGLTRPNGSATTYSYDNLTRLTELANKTSSEAIINRHVYAYNDQDLRSNETTTNVAPLNFSSDELITYDYNRLNQLLSSTNPAKVYTYDDDGNMTQGYTPNGYVFSASYDAENRLKSIEYTDSGSVLHRTEYHYGADSLVARQILYENGLVTSEMRFLHDGFLSVQERDGSNNLVREYAWGINMGGGIGGLLDLIQGGQNYSYLYDGKGNVSAIVDGTQAVAATYAYDTFGNLMTKTGFLSQPVQFSTKRYDEMSGLSYYGYRFYSPVLGRWMNRDPLQEAGDINLYGFISNNPVDLVDYYGLIRMEQLSRGISQLVGGGVTVGVAIYLAAQTSLVSTPLSISAAIKGGASAGAGLRNIFDSFRDSKNPFITAGLGENIGNTIAVYTGNRNAQISGKIVDLIHSRLPGPGDASSFGTNYDTLEDILGTIKAGENLYGAMNTFKDQYEMANPNFTTNFCE